MNYTYPSIQINVIEELHRVYDELIYIKRNQSEYQFKLKQQYLKLEKKYIENIKKQEKTINQLNEIILKQNIKLDILYNILNNKMSIEKLIN